MALPISNKETKDDSLGIVFIGTAKEAEHAVFSVNKLTTDKKFGFHFIFTDGVNKNYEVFKDRDFGDGSITISPSNIILDDFLEDMKRLSA